MSTEPVYATSLETAKEGETVLYLYNGGHPEAVVITKATATKLEVSGKSYKFNREGSEKGNRYGMARIRATTAEDLAERVQRASDANEFADLRYRLRETRWGDLTLDQLRQVHALIQSF